MSAMQLKEASIVNETTIALGFIDENGVEQEVDIPLIKGANELDIATQFHNASHVIAEIGQ